MYDLAIIGAWTEFAVRWAHVITAIAWIGSSFYFIALDLGLRRAPDMPAGVSGEEWQVHGGGFYHIQKYMVAPDRLPDHLTWFKWEAYFTWISGFALLILVYYLGARFYLIDPAVADLAVWQAVAISLASLGLGWVVYDRLCRSALGLGETQLMALLYVLLVAVAWAYTQVFSGRAALLHLGAFTATIMSANVFALIIPNQKVVVADLKAGRTPDPKLGQAAKQRSIHNNYLTLPVLFLMLSVHYPLAFASDLNWAVASLVFLMGVTIRHWFNTRHAGGGSPAWTWAATAVLFVLIMWLSTAPLFRDEGAPAAELSGAPARLAAADGFGAVHDIVAARCSVCHAAEPAWAGLHWPPNGVRLESATQVARNAWRIYIQAGVTHAMPPGNLSGMTEAERARIVAWFEGAG